MKGDWPVWKDELESIWVSWEPEAVVAGVSMVEEDSPGVGAGDGSSPERKRLEMPATTMPGWRPRNGQSMAMVPRMRCLKGWGE
jgi:hypothetical protein